MKATVRALLLLLVIPGLSGQEKNAVSLPGEFHSMHEVCVYREKGAIKGCTITLDIDGEEMGILPDASFFIIPCTENDRDLHIRYAYDETEFTKTIYIGDESQGSRTYVSADIDPEGELQVAREFPAGVLEKLERVYSAREDTGNDEERLELMKAGRFFEAFGLVSSIGGFGLSLGGMGVIALGSQPENVDFGKITLGTILFTSSPALFFPGSLFTMIGYDQKRKAFQNAGYAYPENELKKLKNSVWTVTVFSAIAAGTVLLNSKYPGLLSFLLHLEDIPVEPIVILSSALVVYTTVYIDNVVTIPKLKVKLSTAPRVQGYY